MLPRMAAHDEVEIVEEMYEFGAAATHFVDAFWADKAESRRLTRDQRRRLQREQVEEFRRRYGGASRSTRRRATLFVMRDASGVVGCAGVEVEEPPLGGPGVPLMSNLAVAAAGRRRGLAKRLVKACEKQTKLWGLNELALVVEERNERARNLYSKLGYRVVAKDEQATTLLPLADGRIISETTTALTMRRNLILPRVDPLIVSAGVAAFAVVFLRHGRFLVDFSTTTAISSRTSNTAPATWSPDASSASSVLAAFFRWLQLAVSPNSP